MVVPVTTPLIGGAVAHGQDAERKRNPESRVMRWVGKVAGIGALLLVLAAVITQQVGFVSTVQIMG